ncbi:MAG: serine hydrolase [Vulcanimicrobiaceae bacterium]
MLVQMTLPSEGQVRAWASQSRLSNGLSFVLQALDRHEGSLGIDAERSLYPASMIKVPLAAAALCQVADGRLALERQVEILVENMTANDAPSPLEPGYVATVGELIQRAIARSDNVATNTLFDELGRERATHIAQDRLGLRATSFRRKLSGSEPLIHDSGWDGSRLNTHPAADAARLFQAIACGEVPHAGLLRAALHAQVWNDKLSAGLAEGDAFDHKTGETDDVCHDGGILTTSSGRTYVLVVYTNLPSTIEHDRCFSDFMRRLRPALAP